MNTKAEILSLELLAEQLATLRVLTCVHKDMGIYVQISECQLMSWVLNKY